MSRKLEKRELYKRYSGICLSEEEYNLLENTGTIPKDLGRVFQGTYVRDSINKSFLQGAVINNICSTGAKLFLEDWEKLKMFGMGHTAAFVFQDYFVIVAEPELNLQDSFDPLPDVLPIAIPLCRIKDVSSEKYVSWYKMKITFDDRSQYTAITGNYSSYNHTYIFAVNFSFNANERLISGISREIRNADNNQRQIEAALMRFVREAKSDWGDRRLAIENLFEDAQSIYKLEKYVYSGDNAFVDAFVQNIDNICDDASAKIVDLLNQIKEEKEIKERQITELQKNNRELEAKAQEKKKELSSAGFFKRGGIKREIASIEDQISTNNNKESELRKGRTNYKAAYDAILNAATGRSDSSIRVTDDEFELAKQVYALCEQRKVTQLETEDEKSIFSMICNQVGVPERLQNKDFFNLGAPVKKKKIKQKNGLSDKLKKKRIQKQVEYGEEKDKTKIVGIEKYIAKAIEEQRKAEGNAAAQDLIAKMSTPLKPVTHDSAIVGGLVSGVAGSVVGVAAAAKTEASNAAARASYAEAEARSYQIKATAYAKQNQYLRDAKTYENEVQQIQSKLCDTNNTKKYFDYLNCSIGNYSVEDDGSMSIFVNTSFSKEPKIGEMAVAIDGSLHILVLKEGRIVGDGYLCAEGFNNTYLKSVGFKDNKQYSVIGLPMQGEFDAKEKYDFKVEPINIWVIEI